MMIDKGARIRAIGRPTGNVDLAFTIGDKELNMNITFSVKQN